jgi:predicted dehydrogenase
MNQQMVHNPRVAIIGLGGMGRMHFECYNAMNPNPLLALYDASEARRRGDWSGIELNLDADNKSNLVDLSAYRAYDSYETLLQDGEIDIVDICTPTPQHAPLAIAALRAGKHVFCEKPMAFTVNEAAQMENAARENNRFLTIGHCLRFDTHYETVKKFVDEQTYGAPLYARLFRIADTPPSWFRDQKKSGGVLLDMNIHDIDAALWWFGVPQSSQCRGVFHNGLLSFSDATFEYSQGLRVSVHGAWDPNGRDFAMGFEVAFENATVAWDSSKSPDLVLFQNDKSEILPVEKTHMYRRELEEFVNCVREGREPKIVTPQSSRATLETTLQLLQMCEASR